MAWKGFPQTLQQIRDLVFFSGCSFRAFCRRGPFFFFFFHLLLPSLPLSSLGDDPTLAVHSSSLSSFSTSEQPDEAPSLSSTFVSAGSAEVLCGGSPPPPPPPPGLWWLSSFLKCGSVKTQLMGSSSSLPGSSSSLPGSSSSLLGSSSSLLGSSSSLPGSSSVFLSGSSSSCC